jgi:CheY-like chemotaxis protein
MPQQPLRIFYLEDNPLLVFHVESLLEELGYAFAGSMASFADLKRNFAELEMDAALIDLDLADGRTGPDAAAWLRKRGIPSIFVTGQDMTADANASLVLGTIRKPIASTEFASKLLLFVTPGRL